MIDLPPKTFISSIDGPCIFHFKSREHDKDSPPHYYLIVPLWEDGLLTIMMTSQLDKRISFYERNPKGNRLIDCLVHVDSNRFDFLSREKKTVLECNRARMVSPSELESVIDPDVPAKIVCRENGIPPELIKNSLLAVSRSPMQSKKVQTAVKEYLQKRG